MSQPRWFGRVRVVVDQDGLKPGLPESALLSVDRVGFVLEGWVRFKGLNGFVWVRFRGGVSHLKELMASFGFVLGSFSWLSHLFYVI